MNIDTHIDEVAREMTAGDAGPNLRVRVVADIEQPQRFVLWRPVFATACAAGAGIALLLVTLNRPDVAAPSAKASAPSAKVPAPSATVPAPAAKVLEASAKVPSPMANPFVEESLKEDAIVVVSIAPAPVAKPESIVLEELPSITPIAVTPIGQGEER